MRAEPALSPPDSSGFAVVGEWGAGGRYAGAMRLAAPARIREPLDLSFLGGAARARDGLEIDLGEVEWVSPAGVAGLLAACLGASANALDATVLLPESRTVRTYLGQIGFLTELERNGWEWGNGIIATEVDDPDESWWTEIESLDIDPALSIGPHLPVTYLTTENEVTDASYQLQDVISAAGLSGGRFDELVTVVVELAGNACEHGSECYAIAQVYGGERSGTPGVHLAVADFGEGFAETLREHHGPMTDSEAIVRAFEEQVSGTGHPYRGFGLSQIVDVIDAAPGNVLHIVSRSGYITRSGGRVEPHENATPLFRGTLASVYIPGRPSRPL